MSTPSIISRSEFEQTLSRQRQMSFSIVYVGLIMGIVTFAVIAFSIPANVQNSDQGGRSILLLLSGVHGLMALTIYTIAPIIFQRQLSMERISASASSAPMSERILGAIQTAHIIRMAMYEGTAMFGLVICLLTSLWGYSATDPELLLNGLSAHFFLIMAAATFPTKERLMNIFSDFFERTSFRG